MAVPGELKEAMAAAWAEMRKEYEDLGMIESTGTRPASLPSSGSVQRCPASDNVQSHRRQVATAGPHQFNE